MSPRATLTVCVQHDGRGSWEVVMPEQTRHLRCETFEDACRIAYLCVAHTRPCELVVHDAYHRVLRRERLAGHDEGIAVPSRAPGSVGSRAGGSGSAR